MRKREWVLIATAVIVGVAIEAWRFKTRAYQAPAIDVPTASAFAARYTRSRELLDYFAGCPTHTARQARGALVEERIAVNREFARMRKAVSESPHSKQASVIDRQLQLYASPAPEDRIAHHAACVRLAYLAPVSKADVLASIAATEDLIRVPGGSS